MIAITAQPHVRDRLRAVAATIGLGAPRCYARLSELGGVATGEETVLVVDLASCCDDPRAAVALHEWASRNPDVAVILFIPLVERDRELRLLYELAASGVGQMMTPSDFERIEVWRNVIAHETLSGLQRELRADFLRAVCVTGRVLRAEQIVLQLLADAPRISDVHRTIANYLGRPSPRSDVCRRVASAFLRRSGQLPASRLLLLCRLAWYRLLVERGWTPRVIASFLGVPSPRLLRLAFRRRLGLHMGDVVGAPYEAVLAAIAEAFAGEPSPLACHKTAPKRPNGSL